MFNKKNEWFCLSDFSIWRMENFKVIWITWSIHFFQKMCTEGYLFLFFPQTDGLFCSTPKKKSYNFSQIPIMLASKRGKINMNLSVKFIKSLKSSMKEIESIHPEWVTVKVYGYLSRSPVSKQKLLGRYLQNVMKYRKIFFPLYLFFSLCKFKTKGEANVFDWTVFFSKDYQGV